MKISVIGTGKTGSKVVEMLGDRLAVAFDGQNPPTAEKLKGSDAIIIFVPGDAVADVLPIVLESGVPAAWGSTGFDWPKDINEQLVAKGTKWVIASNFSLGMNLIRRSIREISKGSSVLNHPVFSIHEVHHKHKLDAPSGTALSWKEWLAKEVEVSSEREGDVKGIHELRVRTQTEEILLRHEAKDRALFAEGAIWTAQQLIWNPELMNGIHTFDDLFDQTMKDLES